MRCHIEDGAPLLATCMECGHQIMAHIRISGWCLECCEIQLARLDMTEELHTRVDRLTFAVQILTERLDAGVIEDMQRRLDAFVSSWPRDERKRHDH